MAPEWRESVEPVNQYRGDNLLAPLVRHIVLVLVVVLVLERVCW